MKRTWRNGLKKLRIGSLVIHERWPSMKDRIGIVVRFSSRGVPIVAWENSLISPVFQAYERIKY